MPFFSIIIPTFNRANLLREALASVAAQSFYDFETIVVDDGSNEDIESVTRASGLPVRYFRQPNSGPGAARNLGLQHAHGEYITFLDSDDVLLPWTLTTFAEVIRDNGRPAWVMGNAVEFHSPEELREVRCTSPRYEQYKDYLASAAVDAWIPGCGVAVQRAAIEAVGGFTGRWINAEDSDLWIRLGEVPGFVHLRAPCTLAYRTHSASAVANMQKLWEGMQHLIAQEKNGGYPGGQMRQMERWRIVTRHTRAGSRSLLSAGWIREAKVLYRDTFRWNCRLGRWKYLLGFWARLRLKTGRVSTLNGDSNQSGREQGIQNPLHRAH